MRYYRMHSKIRIWWGRYWAIQYVANEWLSLGIHINQNRPLIDLFIGPITIAIGNHPIYTDPMYKHRHSCRGFIIGTTADEAIL